MQTTLLSSPKCAGHTLAVTSAAGLSHPICLFYISDHATGSRFLVDTGAAVSVIPPSRTERLHQRQNLSLQASNNTKIATYDMRSLSLELGLRRTFRWVFVIADVKKPILGADFLHHFNLLVDMMALGIVRPSSSMWASPLHIVAKKTPGDGRPCGATLSLIDTSYRISKTSQRPFLVQQSSVRLIWFALITKSQWSQRMSPKLQLLRPSVSSSFSVCHLVCESQHSRSNDLWTKSYTVSTFATHNYIDDILIASATPEEQLAKHSLLINPDKCIIIWSAILGLLRTPCGQDRPSSLREQGRGHP